MLDQVIQSKLSKQGRTNPTGIFEGTPTNAAIVIEGGTTPRVSTAVPAIENPIDVVYGTSPQPTYLDYMRTTNRP